MTDLQKNGVKIGVNGVRNLAEELQKKSLQIKERVLGEAHPDTIMSYNNLAGVFAPGDNKRALSYFLKAYYFLDQGRVRPSKCTNYFGKYENSVL